jgi:hypothetical protein
MLTAAEMKLRKSGVALWLTALNPEPLLMIQESELGHTLGRARMFFNLEQAVKAFQTQTANDQAAPSAAAVSSG